MAIYDEQIKQKESLWGPILETCKNNPQLSEPHLQGITYLDVNEAVNTLVLWLKNLGEKPRESRSYKIVKHLLTTTLSNMIVNLTSIAGGSYNHFGPLVQNINQAISGLFPLTYLSDDAKKIRTAEDLSAVFAERASELETLIESLEEKIELLESVEEKKSLADSSLSEIETNKNNSKTVLNEIGGLRDSAQQLSTNISELKTQSEAHKIHLDTFVITSNEIKARLDENEEQLTTLLKRSEEAQETVEQLLPGATATGLAAASEKRAVDVGEGKGWWLFGFVLTLLGLSAAIILSFTEYFPLGDNFLLNFTKRVSIAAPMIWLAYFCAINYGHKLRLQEVYAFKAVASRTFEGYKKQFTEIEKDKPPREGEPSLVKALSLIFMQILAKDPMNVYERKKDDETPMGGAVSGGVAAFFKKILPFSQD